MGGGPRVTVIVKATFGMARDSDARLIAPLAVVTEDRTHGGSGGLAEASEVAPYLPNAGVLLTGHACSPHPVAALTARLAVFRERPLIDKSLHVFGDRASTAANGQPFTKMPFTYERAYGGAGFLDNPSGVGAATAARALPSFLDPVNPHKPAGFGPLARRWGARLRLLGSRVPEGIDGPNATIPEGFDWRYFHAAPADQQCELLQGDEWIVLDGMHPTLPRLQTRLPSARASAIWLAAGATGLADGQPVNLVADTLIIDADQQRCSLIWRGHVALEHLDALAGSQFFTGIEMPGYPMVWPEVRPSLQLARSALPFVRGPSEDPRPAAPAPAPMPSSEPRPNLGATLDASPISPFARVLPFEIGPGTSFKLGGSSTPASAAAPPAPAPPPAPPPAPAMRPQFADEADERTETIDLAVLEARGRKPVAPFELSAPGTRESAPMLTIPGAPWSPVVAPLPHVTAPISIENESTQDAGAPIWVEDVSLNVLGAPETAEDMSKTVPGAPEAAEDMSKTVPGAPETLEDMSKTVPGAPGTLEDMSKTVPGAPETLEDMSKAVSGAPTAVFDASTSPDASAGPAQDREAEPGSPLRAAVLARLRAKESLHDLNLVGADLRELDFTGVQLSRINLKGATLSRCRFENARLVETQLGDADLTEANLAGADLSQADLGRAQLGRARFDGATLVDAKLTGAHGPGASFVEVRATRAMFAGGEWDGASFQRAELTGADFTAASLAGARLDGACLIEANLADVSGAGAVFDDARLPQARAQGAAFSGGSFLRVDAAGSTWEKAVLDEASFEGAKLEEANLARASCVRTRFASANLGGADLQRLTGDGATLHAARLDGADLRQARLPNASFDGATMRNVSAGKADLSRCRFVGADLQGANLRGARLTGASLVRADLQGADLRDADLQGANLFGASRKTAKLSVGASELLEVDPDAPDEPDAPKL
jgi:uncharacterized protein YjbI with pentapeptide repeats